MEELFILIWNTSLHILYGFDGWLLWFVLILFRIYI